MSTSNALVNAAANFSRLEPSGATDEAPTLFVIERGGRPVLNGRGAIMAYPTYGLAEEYTLDEEIVTKYVREER
jgi:hypothetical protein